MLDFNNSQSKIVNIDREGKALQRCNLSARPMPEDGQGHVLSHMLLPSRSSFGYKAINLLSWCEAPIRVKQAKSSAPVGHMSVLTFRCRVYCSQLDTDAYNGEIGAVVISMIRCQS